MFFRLYPVRKEQRRKNPRWEKNKGVIKSKLGNYSIDLGVCFFVLPICQLSSFVSLDILMLMMEVWKKKVSTNEISDDGNDIKMISLLI